MKIYQEVIKLQLNLKQILHLSYISVDFLDIFP